MKITYLYNSGFYVREDKLLFIFDYIPEGGAALDRSLVSNAEHTYVFVSHSHGDHFSQEIWKWKQDHITYLLSTDVPGEGVHLKKGDVWTDERVCVRAYGSTDEGISFEVKVNGKILFHAGDLNCWHWTEENTRKEEQEARAWFSRELDEIEKTAEKIDVAFFPVDSRMRGNYDDGAVQFISRMHPKLFIPMHFREDESAPKQFAKKEFPGTRIVAMVKPMEQIEY